MENALRITINVIVHATEESSKFLNAFEDAFGLQKEEFSSDSAVGHYDNPITILHATLRKDSARSFLTALLGKLDSSQRDVMIEEIEKRMSGSRFHLRLGKQDFLNGILSFKEEDAIRLEIHTPVYNKKDTVMTFIRMFQYTTS